MSCIGIITGGLSAELSLALAGAGIAMTIYDAKISIDGVSYANKLKEQAQTTHEAKDAAKIMADNIAKLTIDVINVICTVAGYLKGKKKIENKQTTENLLRQSKCSEESLLKYLENVDQSNARYGKTTNYAETYKKKGKWPDDIQIPKDSSFINSNSGEIRYKDLAPDAGYLKGTKKSISDGIKLPEKGTKIDRYGSPNGRYTSPILNDKPFSYEKRSLPFIEDSRQYHVYEIQFDSILEAIYNIKDSRARNYFLNKYQQSTTIFSKGTIAPAFNQPGGGIQYEFGFLISELLQINYLKEIK